MSLLHLYQCVIKRVLDGNTVECDVALSDNTWLRDTDSNRGGVIVKLSGIQALGCDGHDLVENFFGEMAKSALEKLLPPGTECFLQSYSLQLGNPINAVGDFLPSAEPDHSTYAATLYMLRTAHAIHFPKQLSNPARRKLHRLNQLELIRRGQVTVPGDLEKLFITRGLLQSAPSSSEREAKHD